MKNTHSTLFIRGLTVALLTVGLTGCKTYYYNAQYIDAESAQQNFQNDMMRCQAYSRGLTPMPPSHQVQHYDYVVTGTAHTTPVYGGYHTTFDAQVTPVPSMADSVMSTTTSIIQVATLIQRGKLYESCMKHLGWTKNKKEAFPYSDLKLDAPAKTADVLSPTFYTPLEAEQKLNLTVNVEPIAFGDLVFNNNGNTYKLDVNAFNQALQAELGAHFARVAVTPEEKAKADIKINVSTRFVTDVQSLEYSGFVIVEFYDNAGQLLYTVRHDGRAHFQIDNTKLDERAKRLTELSLSDLIRNAGWKMATPDFMKHFPAGAVETAKPKAPVAKKGKPSGLNPVEEALAQNPGYKKELTACLCSRGFKAFAMAIAFATDIDKKPFDYEAATSSTLLSYLARVEGMAAPQKIKDLATTLPLSETQPVCQSYMYTVPHSKELARMKADSVYANDVMKRELTAVYGAERAQTILEKVGNMADFLK